MNEKLGQVFTPQEVSDKMVELFSLSKDAKILDPCFGDGVFIKSLISHDYKNIYGVEIDKDLFDKLKMPNVNTRNCNFMDLDCDNTFDGIIVNPPYIRQEAINDLIEYGINKEYLKNKFYKYSLSSRSNLYYYFIFKCIECLKDNGELVVIIPKTWNQTRIGKSVEQKILKIVTIEKIEKLEINVFGNGVLVDADIIKFVKKRSNSITNALSIDDRHIRLNKIARTRRGITSGDNKFFVFNKNELPFNIKYFEKILSSPKQINGFETKNNNEYDYILNIQEDISYLEKPLRDYINSNQKEHKTKDWYKIKTFDCSGIIFGYIIRDNMRFILNNDDCLIRDNFYITYDFDESNYLLLGLLNNYYVFNYLETTGKKYGNGILKIQKYDVDEIPVINPNIISDKDKKEIIKVVQSNCSNSVEKISCILEKYENNPLDEIKKQYYNMVALRKRGG